MVPHACRSGRIGEALEVLQVAGDEAVAGLTDEHQGGIDRILGTRPADQRPGRPSRSIIDRAHVHAAK